MRKGAFTDNRGNIGDFSSRGVRQTDQEGVLIKLTAVLVLKTNDGSEIWACQLELKSELQVGWVYFDIFSYSTGNLKKLIWKKVSIWTYGYRDKSFL